METVSYTHARANLAALMNRAAEGEIIRITRQGTKAVRLVVDDMDETDYLLSSKANKKALDDAIKGIARGEVVRMTLKEFKKQAAQARKQRDIKNRRTKKR